MRLFLKNTEILLKQNRTEESSSIFSVLDEDLNISVILL